MALEKFIIKGIIINLMYHQIVTDTTERLKKYSLTLIRGWSGGAMVLGKVPAPGHPTIWMGGGGRVVRWCWVNSQCRAVLQFGLQ